MGLRLAALVAAATLAVWGWYEATAGRESTHNAQVDAEVVAVPSRAAGVVRYVCFRENQSVKAGDLLATLDDEAANERLEEAMAMLASAQASAAAADADVRVAEASAAGSKAVMDASRVEGARARASAAHAQAVAAAIARQLAALDLSDTLIVAPRDGTVSKKMIAEGQAVVVGQPIAQLATPGVWVTANFKETQLEDLSEGQHVDVTIDAISSVKILGEVENVPGATGPRLMLPPADGASGSFIRAAQRIPVRIRVSPPKGLVLRPGMRADVTVDTRS